VDHHQLPTPCKSGESKQKCKYSSFIVITLFISLLNFFSSVISKFLSIWVVIFGKCFSHSKVSGLDPAAD
jgi:hypothetical protein